MTFKEAILKMRIYVPLHPFVAQVFDYFDIVSFKLPPNSHRLIVEFYVIFLEYYGVVPLVAHFAYIYGLKAFAKHAVFWYLTGPDDSAWISGLPNNLGPLKYNFFFYPSEHYGEFKAGCK